MEPHFPPDHAEALLENAYIKQGTKERIRVSRTVEFQPAILSVAYSKLIDLREAIDAIRPSIDVNRAFDPTNPKGIPHHGRFEEALCLRVQLESACPWLLEVLDVARDLVTKANPETGIEGVRKPLLLLPMTRDCVLSTLFDLATEANQRLAADRRRSGSSASESSVRVPPKPKKTRSDATAWSRDPEETRRMVESILERMRGEPALTRIDAARELGIELTSYHQLSDHLRQTVKGDLYQKWREAGQRK